MSIKVLVADDEPSIRDLVRIMLEGEGYEVVVASNGVEALRKAEAWMPDLILLDVMMPAKDEWEVARILKNQEKTKHIPCPSSPFSLRLLGRELAESRPKSRGVTATFLNHSPRAVS